MYQCLPVGLVGFHAAGGLGGPAQFGRIDELGFVVKKDIQLVVADPAQVQKAIEKFYREESESVTDILKELGDGQGDRQGSQRGGGHGRRDDDGAAWPTRRRSSAS